MTTPEQSPKVVLVDKKTEPEVDVPADDDLLRAMQEVLDRIRGGKA